MDYQKLFEISIFHDYYRDKICPDLTIEPTPECRQLLDSHRLLLRKKVNGIIIITPVLPGGKPFLELDDQLSFNFLLKIDNPHFLDFTKIDPKFIRTPVGRYFYAFSNENNTEVGVSNLESTFNSWSELQFPRGQNVLGMVKIDSNSSLPKVATQVSEYQINFQAKQHYWYYYLIADDKSNGKVFLIEDRETTREPKINFTQTELSQSNTNYVHTLFGSQFPGKLLYLFKSDQEVTCQKEGRDRKSVV